MPSDPHNRHAEYRDKLLGLGESSLRKNYYPELRKHMRELEESRTRYQTIFNATADGLLIHDALTSEVIDVNDRAVQLFGYSVDEIKQLGLKGISSGEEPYTIEKAAKYIKDSLTEKEVQNFEWHSRRKDGSLFWSDIGLKSVVIEGHQCVIASVRDISARKMLEEQLMHSQKMEAMGQLAGGVAHDFNNMLSGIIGAAELICSAETASHEVTDLAQVILKAANTASNLTTQLLSFSRKGTFEQREVHVHHAITNASEILKRSFVRDIIFTLELEAENDVVVGNLSLIENIIINMSLNARDAMPDGGKLSIHTVNKNKHDFMLSDSTVVPEQECLCIIISDTGTGIENSVRQHIFEPFFTTKGTGKGTGLGLAAVYGAVKRHNGDIEVESAIGYGTTFKIYIPVVANATDEESDDTQRKVVGSGKILLVDDEYILRYIGSKSLENLGYDVVTAEDGVKGIEAFKKSRPDLVLLDMVMPNMKSTDCFREMKKIDPTVPVLAVSGFTADTTIDELLAEGLAGFVEKPYKVNDLSQKISAILNKS